MPFGEILLFLLLSSGILRDASAFSHLLFVPLSATFPISGATIPLDGMIALSSQTRRAGPFLPSQFPSLHSGLLPGTFPDDTRKYRACCYGQPKHREASFPCLPGPSMLFM